MARRVFVPELSATPQAPQGASFQLRGATMGTTWSVAGFTDLELAPLAIDIALLLENIVREMSQWETASDLTRFNALTAGGAMTLPEAFAEVLACALDVAAETAGAFDPTLGALVDLWGFGPNKALRPPSEAELNVALAASGWPKLAFDADTRRAVQPGGLKLDFAGIAKGYAVDRLAHLLQARGLTSFLVEVGGELRAFGIRADRQPWWVEIERAPGDDRPAIVAALYNLAIATSGDYRRAGSLGGAWITHTIDPKNGRPLASPLAAVTVLYGDCMRADAYATALMCMGVEAGLAFADARDIAAMFTLRGAKGFTEAFSSAFARQLD